MGFMSVARARSSFKREELEEAIRSAAPALGDDVIVQAARVIEAANALGLRKPIGPDEAARWAAFMDEDAAEAVTREALEEGLPLLVKTTADFELIEREAGAVISRALECSTGEDRSERGES